MLRLPLSLLFALLVFQSVGQTVILTNEGNVAVEEKMLFWRDEAGSLTLEEVKLLQLNKLYSSGSPNFGFDRAAYWFKLEVTNHSDDPRWLLELTYSPLDQIDFYGHDESGNLVHKVSGDTYPIATRDMAHRNSNFTFSIPPKAHQTIYLRVQTISSVQVPVVLWRESVFHEANNTNQLINGLFYGGLLLMLVYQLFQYFFQPSKITFYYIITIMSMVNVVSFFQGYNFLYLHADTPELNDIFAIFTGPAFVVCSTLLTRNFLNLRSFSKVLDLALVVNMSIDVLAGVLMYVFFPKISFKYHHYFMLVHCLLTIFSATYCYLRDYKPARYYLISWLTVLIAASIFTISNLGFIPGYLSTKYLGLMIGCTLQVLFISYALADRLSILHKENQRAKEMELRRNQQENERLEREVKLRTEEILQKNARLEEVIQVKDKLFSVVSHDIKGPLGSLRMALQLLQREIVSPEEFRQLASGLENRFVHTTEFIENLLQWANLQLQSPSFNPEVLQLKPLIRETEQLLEEEIKNKDLRIVNELEDHDQVYGDVNMLRSVFRNLITNAVKFSNQHGQIDIKAVRKDGQCIVSVADHGVGIPLNNQRKLFTLDSITTSGTKQEKGTGLGLLLCKEFVEQHKGTIWFESEANKGTTFYVALPTSAN